MPLTKTGKAIKYDMQKEYGKDKGERVFYATMNKEKMHGKWDKKKSYSKQTVNMAKEML